MKLNELKKFADTFTETEKMPVLFVGHGDPMNALRDNPFTQSLKKAGEDIRKSAPPAAILVVSAHWLTHGSFVSLNEKPGTIHDFGGFPEALFAMQYPAPGAPEYAKEVSRLAPDVKGTNEWGIDHGAWTILHHLFPAATIPVFQLSIDYYQPMHYHFDLAKQLKSLRKKGVLIIGSGNIVHNLRMSMKMFTENDATPYDWNIEFDEWVKKMVIQRNFTALIDYAQMGSAAKLSVPTPDHYIPLLYSLALADEQEPVNQVYEETLSGISMRTFSIG